jgi:hypothetical protein
MSNPLVEIINSASPWAIVCVLGAGAWKLLEALKDLKTQTAKGAPSKAEFDALMARTKVLEDERASEKSERSVLASKVGTLWNKVVSNPHSPRSRRPSQPSSPAAISSSSSATRSVLGRGSWWRPVARRPRTATAWRPLSRGRSRSPCLDVDVGMTTSGRGLQGLRTLGPLEHQQAIGAVRLGEA